MAKGNERVVLTVRLGSAVLARERAPMEVDMKMLTMVSSFLLCFYAFQCFARLGASGFALALQL